MEFDAELAAAVRAGRAGDVTREIEHLTKCLALKLSGEQESLARSHLALAYARSDGEKARGEVKRALGLAKSERARARALLSSATVELRPNAQAPVHRLPVVEPLEAWHWRASFTLVPGRVVHDYLA